ncbi:MAG: hypothetical protein IMF11_21860 [Proteobacteria bacterium]|nr:hypothetical protein [Pseudomonadota bacterium]
MKDKRREESKSKKGEHKGKGRFPVRKGILGTALEKARGNKEAPKYAALFLSFCVAFYPLYYFITLRGSMSLLKNITASILGAIFFFAKLILIARGYTPRKYLR